MQSFYHISKVHGTLHLKGDKSISHRSLILSSLSRPKSRLLNLSDGDDVKSTINCLRMIGVRIHHDEKEVIVSDTVPPPHRSVHLYAGNSGTTVRLLSGLLIHKNFESVISGDESLSSRPMKRIVEPLSLMGGKLKASDKDTLPLFIYPSHNLNPFEFTMNVPSAQVKGAIIISGLHLDQTSKVTENIPTRDHTERILGLKSITDNSAKTIYVSKKDFPSIEEFFIPGDVSSAAFYVVLALLADEAELVIKDASLNPTRTAYLDILKEMGGNIEYAAQKISCNEPYGDIIVKSSSLHNVEIPASIIPLIIDEIPILAAAGLFAEGSFTIKNASELRYKECDRIKAMVHNFRLMGLSVEEFEDGFSVEGFPSVDQCTFDSFNDHRIAMAFAVVSLLLRNGGKVDNFNSVGISNPEFLNHIKQITG